MTGYSIAKVKITDMDKYPKEVLGRFDYLNKVALSAYLFPYKIPLNPF
jgi:hypothetical protein